MRGSVLESKTFRGALQTTLLMAADMVVMRTEKVRSRPSIIDGDIDSFTSHSLRYCRAPEPLMVGNRSYGCAVDRLNLRTSWYCPLSPSRGRSSPLVTSELVRTSDLAHSSYCATCKQSIPHHYAHPDENAPPMPTLCKYTHVPPRFELRRLRARLVRKYHPLRILTQHRLPHETTCL